jgi:hypothetical protein
VARNYTLKRKRPETSIPGRGMAVPGSEDAVSGRSADAAAHGLVNCSISHPKPENPENRKIGDLEARASWIESIMGLSRVVGFKVYRKDIVPVRKAWEPNQPEVSERGLITELSRKSLQKLCLYASNSPVDCRSFITLTYPKDYPCDGKEVKRHLNLILTALRKRIGKFSYLWFLEFQRRGAPHFHIFCGYELPAPLCPMRRETGRRVKEVRVNWEHQDWLCDRWFEIVDSGDEKHRRVGAAWEVVEKPDGMARYVAKEAYKTFQKVVPKDYQNVGRFWGTSRDFKPAEPETIWAGLEELKAILPAGSFGEGGEPFPICFEGAEAYRAVMGTDLDPLYKRAKNRKLREWKFTAPQKMLNSGKLMQDSVSLKPVAIHDRDW